MASHESEPAGSVIAGRFRIETPLGEGGMAQVYRVRDIATKRALALKLLKPKVAEDPQAVMRLRREGEVLSQLAHPAIVGVETFGKLDDGRLFIAMELLEGETFGERMRRSGRIDPTALTPIVTGAAAGLSAAHRQQIIHRDLKPDNIFLAGDPVQVKLLDFGISKVLGLARLTRTGQILGTPRYMAPEQLSDAEDVDLRIDIYALGVMLYEAIAGTPPFVGTNPSALIVAILRGDAVPLRTYCPQVDPSVEEVVMRAMARSREARFPTALDLAEAWVDAVSKSIGTAATSFFGGPASGKATRAMGGTGMPAEVQQAAPAQLRAGTFPQMAEAKAQTVRAKPVSPKANTSAAESAHHDEGIAAPAHAAAAPEANVPPEAELSLPPRGSIWPVLVIALFAGAATGAVALHLIQDSAENDAPANVQSASEATQVPHGTLADSGIGLNAPDVSNETTEAPPVGELPPAMPVEEQEASEVASQRPRSEMRRRRRRRTERREEPVEMQASREHSNPLAEARAALSVGNTPRCLEILEQMGRRRSAAALKLEADCHQRGGDRAAALRALERYCRTFPDGSAVGEVRQRVAALGGSCI